MLLLLSGVGEGGTATRVGRRKDLVGEESVLTDNIPIGANEAPSLGLLGEESLLDLILQNSDMCNKGRLQKKNGIMWEYFPY